MTESTNTGKKFLVMSRLLQIFKVLHLGQTLDKTKSREPTITDIRSIAHLTTTGEKEWRYHIQ